MVSQLDLPFRQPRLENRPAQLLGAEVEGSGVIERSGDLDVKGHRATIGATPSARPAVPAFAMIPP
jgi:hypothetical protein